MGTLRAEAILVGRVCDGVDDSVRTCVWKGPCCHLRLQILLPDILQVSLLLRDDSIAGLITESIQILDYLLANMQTPILFASIVVVHACMFLNLNKESEILKYQVTDFEDFCLRNCDVL
jgi:hypothetical protein